MRYVAAFTDARAVARAEFGGKVASLARLAAHGFRVPPGFGITCEASRLFLAAAGRAEAVDALLPIATVGDLTTLDKRVDELRAELAAAPMPQDVVAEVATAYELLCAAAGQSEVAVAVRSSGSAEDGQEASFAGEFDSVIDVRGLPDIQDALRSCWLSNLSTRALVYAADRGLAAAQIGLGVACQLMVHARAAGVMFSLDPVTGDDSVIVIEGSWGLGHAVVSGLLTPDRVIVDKASRAVIGVQVATKATEYLPGARGPQLVPADRQQQLCLDGGEVEALTELALRVEALEGACVDVEWAVDERYDCPESVQLLQCRPETVWARRR